jgi:two-component system NtrC family response regulator
VRLLQRVAPTESTVLLTGESGTGKELFAKAIHALSPRRSGPCVALNCAAIPDSLIENELFGHEKGAFTGADRRQPGRFELAERGTLLLDEIGELPLGVQGKVLRVLEERTYERVGGGRTQRADVRLVAATNRDLETMVREGTFRADLFFRLNVFPIELPALRERTSDIPLLARHLLGEIARRHHTEPPRLDDEAAGLLAAEPWPGNVRELANVIEHAAILCDEGPITAAHLPGNFALRRLRGPHFKLSGAMTLREIELQAIQQALDRHSGNKPKAAEELGVSLKTLYNKLNQVSQLEQSA